MKLATIATIVFVGAHFATPVFAVPFDLGAHESSYFIEVAQKKYNKKPKKKQNYNSARGYIPGHVLTPYGYRDCIGWWERHPDGRMQCHGQLIRDY